MGERKGLDMPVQTGTGNRIRLRRDLAPALELIIITLYSSKLGIPVVNC